MIALRNHFDLRWVFGIFLLPTVLFTQTGRQKTKTRFLPGVVDGARVGRAGGAHISLGKDKVSLSFASAICGRVVHVWRCAPAGVHSRRGA
jgi:hypothetical protein